MESCEECFFGELTAYFACGTATGLSYLLIKELDNTAFVRLATDICGISHTSSRLRFRRLVINYWVLWHR
jgi:hypothetical protein